MSLQLTGRKIRSEAEARACFAAMTEQGSTVYLYAKEHGLSTRSLSRWGRLLERSHPAGEANVERSPRLDPKRMGEMLTDWEGAGGDVATFRRNRGLSADGRRGGRGRPRGKTAMTSPGRRLVEVVPAMEPAMTRRGQALGATESEPAPSRPCFARYEVVVGDVRLVVGDGFREDTLRRLVAAVSPC